MRVRSIVVAVCSALILVAGGFATKAVSWESSPATIPADPDAERVGGLGFSKLDRGNTRTVWTKVVLDSGTLFRSLEMDPAVEIDCTSINISLAPAGVVPAAFMLKSYLSTASTYPANLTLTVPNTYHFTYSPPLRLRAGDRIYFGQRGAILPPGTILDCEITLHGFQPAASELQGMMVQ